MTAISENLVLSVRNKKSHEARFYNILNALSENKVDMRFFSETLRFLSIPELKDIVEERISKIKCGYVLCDNTIDIHFTASVSLNPSKRKIFNISNRKKFCSNWCYGAYKHILSQLPDEPMWLNKNVNLIKFNFYPKNAPGCEGEIMYEDASLNDDSVINSNEQYNVKPNKSKSNETLHENSVVKHQIVKPIKSDEKRIEKIQNVIKSLDNLVVKKSKNLDDVIKKIKDNSERKKERKIVLLDEYLEDKNTTIPLSEENIFIDLKKVKNVICEWITEKTRDYICEINNNDLDDVYSESDEEDEDNKEIIYDEDSQPMSLPTLDSSNQMSIRRHILIKKAKKICIPLVADFNICSTGFMNEFEKFINTCRLTSTNIVISSKEFKWLIIVVIDLLSSKFDDLKNINKTQILNKHGIVSMKLYDKILMEINNIISQPLNILVSSQGDHSYV